MVNIAGIILAAGMSRRMGRPKQLIPFNGKVLFRYSVDAAVGANLSPIVLVGGKYSEELRRHIGDVSDIEVIENRDYETGMASSLKLGINAVTGLSQAAVVFLADQPFVPPKVIYKIVEEYEQHRKEGVRIIRPEYNGIPGHPILFDADLFNEFESIEGDEGGRTLIKNHHSRLKSIIFHNIRWGIDIDTPDDLLKYNNHKIVEA